MTPETPILLAMMINLARFTERDRIRFLDGSTGKEIKIDGLVTSIDPDTGDYVAYKTTGNRIIRDGRGRPVMVNGSLKRPIEINLIGGSLPWWARF